MRIGKSHRFHPAFMVIALMALVTGTCHAHVVLTEPDATPGTRYVAHFRVGHGCSGSPTVALTIAIPPQVSAVVPETPDGWQVSTVRENGRITAVTWKAGVVVPDKPGVFTIAMTLPAAEGTLAFPATQTCETGEEHWAEVGVGNSKRPAPLLRVARNTGAPSALVISDGWFRALPATVPSGAYFILRNTGTKPATLRGADSPACGMLTIHRSESQGSVSSMTDLATVEVPAGGEVHFAPGGYHLMCMDAKPALKPGAQVPVTLDFSDAGPVTAQFDVRDAAGK